MIVTSQDLRLVCFFICGQFERRGKEGEGREVEVSRVKLAENCSNFWPTLLCPLSIQTGQMRKKLLVLSDCWCYTSIKLKNKIKNNIWLFMLSFTCVNDYSFQLTCVQYNLPHPLLKVTMAFEWNCSVSLY